MNAHETHLGKILEGIKQYVVPLFQRPYKCEVTTWREVLQATLEIVQEMGPDASDGIVEQFPRLIGTDAGKFRSARPLGTTLHFETNLSAEAIARYCQQIVVAAGFSSGDWVVETK